MRGDTDQKEPHKEEAHDNEDAERALEAKGVGERHVPQYDRELLVRERQGPEAEIGGRVRDAVEAELCKSPTSAICQVFLGKARRQTNRVNDLMNHHLAKLELLVLASIPNVLRNHRAPIHIRLIRSATIRLPTVAAFLIILFI